MDRPPRNHEARKASGFQLESARGAELADNSEWFAECRSIAEIGSRATLAVRQDRIA